MTAPATAPARPKRTRKPKAAPVPEPEPQCEQCLKALDWRDRAYTPAGSKLCKRCHQRAQRQALRGRYVQISFRGVPRRPQSLTERLALQSRRFR